MNIDDLLDIYGTCSMDERCKCIQPIKRTSPIEFPQWLGRLCPHWQPNIPNELKRALELSVEAS